MKKISIICYYLLIMLSFPILCFAQKADEQLPMYGNAVKTSEEKEADQEFIKETIDLYKSKEKAFSTFIDVGWKNLSENQIEIAIQKFNKAWLLSPNEADSYFGFCMALTLQKKNNEAEKNFETGQKYDKLKKASMKYFLRASNISERHKDTLMLIDYLKKAAGTDFLNVPVLKKLAYYTAMKGFYDDACFAYASIIRITPNDSTAYCNKANILLKQKKPDEAIATFSAAIVKCQNPFFDAYFGRARAKYDKGDYHGALEDYAKCNEINSKNPVLFRLMGITKNMLWDQKGACEAWKTAKKLGDKQAEELYNSKCK